MSATAAEVERLRMAMVDARSMVLAAAVVLAEAREGDWPRLTKYHLRPAAAAYEAALKKYLEAGAAESAVTP